MENKPCAGCFLQVFIVKEFLGLKKEVPVWVSHHHNSPFMFQTIPIKPINISQNSNKTMSKNKTRSV